MTHPVVAIVGSSDSGKTTVAEALIHALAARGHRVAAVKHCPHGHEVDRAGSDTDRLARAGAVTVVAASPDRLTRMDRLDGEQSLEAIAASVLGEVDIVVAEGFKSGSSPKVLVVGRGETPPDVTGVIATVGAVSPTPGVPDYPRDDLSGLVLQVEGLIRDAGSGGGLASLEVDGVAVPLSGFAMRSLAGVVMGFLTTLKGVPAAPGAVRLLLRLRRR